MAHFKDAQSRTKEKSNSSMSSTFLHHICSSHSTIWFLYLQVTLSSERSWLFPWIMTNQCSDLKCQQIGVPSSCSWGRLTTSARIKEGVMGALFKYALSNIRRPLLHPKFPTSQGESSTYVDLQTQFRNRGPSSSEEDNLGDSYTTASAGSRGSAHMYIVPKGTQPESRNLHHQSQNPVTNRHDLPDHIDNVRCLPTAKPARAISIKCARFWGT